MIPKTIHYCWFGRNPKPKLAKKCLESWKKYCPDYELKEWNEDNFDISSAPLYVRQAYDAKKWAFVTDYVRLWAMVNYGGIYMDTDVEVVEKLDRFLNHQAFSGFESERYIPTGIMACEKGFPLFREFLHYYDSASFIKENGDLDLTTNVIIISNACMEKGLVGNNTFQIIEGLALYPKEYFCPKNNAAGLVESTENTYTIHHFSGSWTTKYEKILLKKMRYFIQRHGFEKGSEEFKQWKYKYRYCLVVVQNGWKWALKRGIEKLLKKCDIQKCK